MDRSHLLTILCIALLSGIGLASWVDLPLAIVFGVFLASLGLVFWLPQSRRWVLVAVAVAGVGVWRYQTVQPVQDQTWVGSLVGRTVTLSGEILEEPDVRVTNARYVVGELMRGSTERGAGSTGSDRPLTRSAAATVPAPPDGGVPRGRGVGGEGEAVALTLRGNILVTNRLYPRYQFGDVVRVTCRLRAPQPFDGFAYDRYLARSDIYALCSNPEVTVLGERQHPVRGPLLELKAGVQQVIDQSLPEPQSSLLAALIMGTRGGLPRPLLDAFAAAGLTHLIAISGSQITLVINLLGRVAPYLGVSRPRAFWGVSGLLVAYLTLIGAPASAVRAGIMGWLLLLAYQLGRQRHAWPMLALAAAVMALHEPRIVRDDLGFQLSFAAVAGLILWQPVFERWLYRVPRKFGLREALSMTLAAQLMTTPLVLVQFGRLSLVAPFTNALVVPLIAAVTVFSLGLLALAWLLPGLAWALLLPVWAALSYLVAVAELSSRLPYASVAWSLPAWTLVPMYAGLAWWGRRLGR